MVGAVLTQNTNWRNVHKAITVLKEEGLMSFEGLEALPVTSLANKIKSCGYYNLKAGRLKNLLHLIRSECNGNLNRLLESSVEQLRHLLLSVKGVGPETADSIILYAAGLPVFVVDAYTHRILSRHNLLSEDESDYQTIQGMFMDSLPQDVALYNEYHALIVKTGKEYCKKTNPRCTICPLNGF